MNVFVTGGTGFLGNNLVRQLLERGYTVRTLARTKEKARTVLSGLDVEIVKGDIQDIPVFADRVEGCAYSSTRQRTSASIFSPATIDQA